jgi:regulator of CtrA degradation
VTVTAAPTAFFNKTFEETMHLLTEMRDYVAHGEPRDRACLSPLDSARLSCAALRATARLTQIMAWLLTQKAVHAGELETEALTQGNGPLSAVDVCMEEEDEAVATALPPQFRTLLDRSHRLYVRVARLDEMVRRNLN